MASSGIIGAAPPHGEGGAVVSPSIVPYGDQAFLLRLAQEVSPAAAGRARVIDAALGQGAHECAHGYVTLAVTFDAMACDAADMRRRVEAAMRSVPSAPPPRTRTVQVPVRYGGEAGPDLEAVAAEMGLSAKEVVARHAGRPYRVYFLGFAPGFAYMGDVDPSIAAARLGSPRRAVAAGSVGVAGRQTGVYPRETPGGWRLLGRTPLQVYDPSRPESALFRQGDEVVFVPTETAPSTGRVESPPDLADPAGEPALQVVRPGLLTTLQDLGRWGHQAEGVAPCGAADPVAARLANRLVGNADGAAVLEITALGPTLGVLRDIAVALVGADLGAGVDGMPLTAGTAVRVGRGTTLTFGGPRLGCRAYLAVAGGFAVVPVLASRSADPLGGLGPGPLRAGDILGAYPARAAASDLAGRRLREEAYVLSPAGSEVDVGVLPGPQAEWFPEAWCGADRPASPASDRVGLRLEGEPVRRRAEWMGQELLSEPNVLGAVQVPPDGRPIVLMAGRPTVGGYPKPGVVCTVDAWRLAQVMPGAGRVRLRRVDLAWARARLAEVRSLLSDGGLIVGG